MPIITVISENNIQKIECAIGTKISDVLSLHGVEIDFPCAGKGRCLQCRVTVTGCGEGGVSPEERAALSVKELANNVRLACLVRVNADICVELRAKPAVEQIAGCGYLPDFDLKPSYQGFAAAIDIGTTTLAASLCAADSALPLKTVVMKNPQTSYGAEVVSRIELSLAGKSAELASCITDALNTLLASLRNEADFSRITICGNTAMLYLLTQQNPSCLSRAPFTLDRPFGETLTANKLALYAPAETPVFLPRCIASFVGADITCAIAASRLCVQNKPSLLVDIGTNGEIALFVPSGRQNKGHNTVCTNLYVCSTAAGPAFEGEGLAQGMRGVSGAIDRVTLVGNSLVCGTIGGVSAIGICGSGIIDAIAVLKQTGIIDETGLIQENGHDFESLICDFGGIDAVRIEKNVLITQKDIRNVQLAKSAICAGIQTLLAESGLTENDVETVFIAGGFGSYVNLQNAALIGLIPAKLCAKAKILGNAALSGTVLMTQNSDFIEESASYSKIVQVVDLAASKIFMNLYIQNMVF